MVHYILDERDIILNYSQSCTRLTGDGMTFTYGRAPRRGCKKKFFCEFFPFGKSQTRNMATRISSKYLKISKVLDWGFFLILFGLAIFFVWSVLQQYSNKDTSFTQYQQPIKKRPTITICIPFFGYPHNINRTDLKFKWIYGKQFPSQIIPFHHKRETI